MESNQFDEKKSTRFRFENSNAFNRQFNLNSPKAPQPYITVSFAARVPDEYVVFKPARVMRKESLLLGV